MANYYNDRVTALVNNPRNVGGLKDADGTGLVGNAAWGIDIELYIRVAGGVITEARYRPFGCGATIATGSVVTEMITGITLDRALAITEQDINRALGGLPPDKIHCVRLGRELIHAAIEDYRVRHREAGPRVS